MSELRECPKRANPEPCPTVVARSVMLDGYSIEITSRDADRLVDARPFLPDGTIVSITFLPGDKASELAEMARRVHQLGLLPQPHISARRIASRQELQWFLEALSTRAAVDRVFVIAGDPSVPIGPFPDSLSIIETGLFAEFGIRTVGLAGHPEPHPVVAEDILWQALRRKCDRLSELGHTPEIITQFVFDAEPLASWLTKLRLQRIDCDVRVGIAGPTNVQALLRFAARCGVSASTSVLAKYGISLRHLLATTTPDRLLRELAMRIDPSAGSVRAHIYPFGGIRKAAEWASLQAEC